MSPKEFVRDGYNKSLTETVPRDREVTTVDDAIDTESIPEVTDWERSTFDYVAALKEVVALYDAGYLDEKEFREAKSKLLRL